MGSPTVVPDVTDGTVINVPSMGGLSLPTGQELEGIDEGSADGVEEGIVDADGDKEGIAEGLPDVEGENDIDGDNVVGITLDDFIDLLPALLNLFADLLPPPLVVALLPLLFFDDLLLSLSFI